MKKLAMLLAVASVVLVSPFVSAAEPLDDTRIEIIRQQCSSAQVTMQRVLRGDTSGRVNRGRAYEETIDLLASFNSRAALNTYNVSGMVESTASIEKEFSNFRAIWIQYDTEMKNALRLNCRQQPVTFYDTLTKAREHRAALTASIAGMDRLLDEYRAGLEAIGQEIKIEADEASNG